MIACGRSHNIILNEINELFVCGWNYYGQLGLGDTQDRNKYVKLENNFGKIKNISCCTMHNIILNELNEIYVCGDNRCGQLGLCYIKNTNKYVNLKHDFGIIKDIYCGYDYRMILNEKNELYVCGENIFGNLCLGYTRYICTDVKLNQNILEYIPNIINNIITLDSNMMIEL
jgi:alpha-tubulin suppressor-like RCC1 family protein